MAVEKLEAVANLDQERIDTFKQLFPEAIADGKINFDVLRDLLADASEDDADNAEHFGLFWPGKREARRLAALPSKGTLAPVPGEGVDEEKTENIFIEGENLEVLKILKKSYAGKIKMIYIDPPYNTGQDFIYKDDYSEPLESYLRRTGQSDEEGNLLVSNSKADGRFHSNWLNMIYPRLKLARELLRDDGVIFVSIDDNEVHNLREVMNEVFGEENQIAILVWEKTRKNDAKLFSVGHEYLVVYAQSKATLNELKVIWREAKPGAKEILEQYQSLRATYGSDNKTIETELRDWYKQLPEKHPSKKLSRYKQVDKSGPWRDRDISWPGGGGPRYDVIHPETKQPCKVPERGWGFATEESMKRQIALGLVVFREDHTKPPFRKAHLMPIPEEVDDEWIEDNDEESDGEEEEAGLQVMPSVIYKQSQVAVKLLRKLMGKKLFDNPKDHEVIARLIRYCTSKDGDIVLDFFAGSATTAHSIFELNSKEKIARKFILVQLPEETKLKDYLTIAELSKDRIRRASDHYQKAEAESLRFAQGFLDLGFRVFKLTSSNFRRWQAQEEENIGGLILQAEQKALTPLVDGAKEPDVLTEIALLEGFALSAKQTRTEEFARNKVTCITDGFNAHRLYVCLDRELWEETVDLVERLPKESVFYCFDNALSDAAKIQLAECCRVVTI